MTRSWYLRLLLALTTVIIAVGALWPSLDQWVGPAPGWLKQVFSEHINPGLDIKGGLRLMYDVDVDEAIRDRRDRLAEGLVERIGTKLGIINEDETPTREQLAKVRKKLTSKALNDAQILLSFTKSSDMQGIDYDFLRENFPELREIERQNNTLKLEIRENQLDTLRQTAIEQTVRTISNRIDEMQIRETTVIGRESDLIVEIPGADKASFNRIRSIISRTAQLEFKVLDDEGSAAFLNQAPTTLPEGITKETEIAPLGLQGGQGRQGPSAYLRAEGKSARQALGKLVSGLNVPQDHELLIGSLDQRNPSDSPVWRTYYVHKLTQVTGEDIQDAYVGYDTEEGNRPYVGMEFNTRGAKSFEEMTGRNVQRRMAIVLDSKVESAPVIQGRIGGGHGRITLGDSDINALTDEARDLSLVLRAGALPAPIRPANEQLVGPTLGRDAVQKGAQGAIIGIACVLLFMLVYYQVGGLVANVMVTLNILFVLAILSGLGATLTLPGIAGIALTVGMAVDANVLINERIREELRLGKSPRASVDQGFGRAFWSIFDSQLTTFIAGIVLYQFGTGPIKGFAVTLMIGILTSLFTGIFCSKIMLDWLVRGLRVKRLRLG